MMRYNCLHVESLIVCVCENRPRLRCTRVNRCMADQVKEGEFLVSPACTLDFPFLLTAVSEQSPGP